jgi:lysophospholipase L1-like esterase
MEVLPEKPPVLSRPVITEVRKARRPVQNAYIVAFLFLLSGLLFLHLAVGFNEMFIGALRPGHPLKKAIVYNIRWSQIYFLILGLTQVLLYVYIRKSQKAQGWFNKNMVANFSLSFLIFFDLIFLLEFSFRPLALKDRAVIFQQDSALGWKFKSNSSDEYLYVHVEINGKGLFGPELTYAKPDNTARILYLGDSVTFGYAMPSYRLSFPYCVEPILQDHVDGQIQTINAGVPGYNTRQEYLYLRQEGIKYDPDLVVVAITLNDVTDRYLAVDALASGNGGLKAFFGKIYTDSGIMYLIRTKLNPMLSPFQARKEQTDMHVKELVFNPERPELQQAWSRQFESLDEMAAYCRERNLKLALVVFPYVFQLDDAEKLSSPQAELRQYAQEHNIPMLDLLPGIADHLEKTGQQPQDIFMDDCHLSQQGAPVIAGMIADFIQSQELIGNKQAHD